MFELPNNTTDQIRPDVVNRMVEALFRVKHLDYCDQSVTMDGTPGFVDRWGAGPDYTQAKRFTQDERKAAFEEFKKKGYHIAYETWYGSRGTLWTYILKESKDTPEDRQFRYIF